MAERRSIDKTFAAELRAAGMEIGAVASRLRACQAKAAVASTWRTMDADRHDLMEKSLADLRRKLRTLEEPIALFLNYNRGGGSDLDPAEGE